MAAHQAPPSLGFSRQEHWSGLPFPSPTRESEVAQSNPQRPHGLQPSRLLPPWDFPGKSTGVGCHCLLHSSELPCKKLDYSKASMLEKSHKKTKRTGLATHGKWEMASLPLVAICIIPFETQIPRGRNEFCGSCPAQIPEHRARGDDNKMAAVWS